MKYISILSLITLTASCSKDTETQIFVDPIVGDEMAFSKSQLNDWQLYQSSEFPNAMISIAKNDSPIIYVTDFPDARWITTGVNADVRLHDVNYDGSIDHIEFYSPDPPEIHKLDLVDGSWKYTVNEIEINNESN